MDLADVPSAPRTPSPRAKDLVFRYQGTHFVLLLMGMIFTLVGSIMSLVFCWGLPADLCLGVGASRTVGARILETDTNRSVTINGVRPTRITFAYRAEGADRTSEVSTTDRQLAAAAKQGDPVEVEICALHSGWARLPGTHVSLLGVYGLFILLFPGLGLGFLTYAIRGRSRRIRAFVQGDATQGEVTFKGPDRSVRVNGRYPTMVEWTFTVNGERHTGRISTLSPAALDGVHEKDPVVVLYDAADPRVNTLFVE